MLSEKAFDLFTKLYSRRMLIRLEGVKLSRLVSGNYQTDLFNNTMEELNLSNAMDRIHTKFGTRAIMGGSALKETEDVIEFTQLLQPALRDIRSSF